MFTVPNRSNYINSQSTITIGDRRSTNTLHNSQHYSSYASEFYSQDEGKRFDINITPKNYFR